MVVGIALDAVVQIVLVFVASLIFANLVPTFITLINTTLYDSFGGILNTFLNTLPTLAGTIQLLILALPIVFIIVKIVRFFTGNQS